MGEALAAVGAAAGILQLVDFSSKLLSTAWRLYKKRGDLSAPDTEVELLATDTKAVLASLRSDTALPLPEELRLCIGACADLVNDLLELIDSLKPDPNKNVVSQAVSKSLRRHKADGKMKSLGERIGRMRRQICDHVNTIVIKNLHQEASKWTFQPKAGTQLQLLTAEISKLAKGSAWERKDAEDKFTAFIAKFEQFHQRTKDHERTHDILTSLHFPQIKERMSDVPDAHRDTLQWIFGETPKANVCEWLSGRTNSLYWVSGQAGSGKSTLMKFLVGSDRTHAALKDWAAPHLVTVASHFFWSAGTRIQKSQEGLFRTLLFQILLQVPELARTLCPGWWDDASFNHLEQWTLPTLFASFHKLAELSDSSYRIAIFIDGLDEYQGDHKALISILDNISRAPHIKVCVSSRPWIHFRNAWQDNEWRIVLQDLTRDDIQNYVRDKFTAYEMPPSHPSLDTPSKAQIDDLAVEICQRAQGVFLWVYLVTKSLLEGLDNGDGMLYLLKRLRVLPSDLEDYFQLMFDSIEKVYWQRIARVFRCLVQHGTPLPVMVFHFMCLEEEDPDFVYKLEASGPLSMEEGEVLIETRRRNIIAQCKDLLRITHDASNFVLLRDEFGFLHRTVFDFLRTQSMSTWLEEKSGPFYDSRRSLSKALLATVKSIPQEYFKHGQVGPSSQQSLVLPIIYYCRELEMLEGKPEAELLDGLSDVFPTNLTFEWLGEMELTLDDLFFRCGLHEYQLHAARKRYMDQGHAKKGVFLESALRRRLDIDAEAGFKLLVKSGIDMVAVENLLQLGVSPNAPTFRGTVWTEFLSSLGPGKQLVGFAKDGSNSIIESIQLLVKYGAARFVSIGLREPQSADRYLEKILSPAELRALGPLTFSSGDDYQLAKARLQERNAARQIGQRTKKAKEVQQAKARKAMHRDKMDVANTA